jgi:hypothetical protein
MDPFTAMAGIGLAGDILGGGGGGNAPAGPVTSGPVTTGPQTIVNGYAGGAGGYYFAKNALPLAVVVGLVIVAAVYFWKR